MPLLETRGSGSASAYGFGGGFEPFSATFVSLFGSTPSRTAPTSLGSYYNGTQLQGRVTLSSGKQLWTVQSSGLYRIKAYGAQGGRGNLNTSGLVGGGGAILQGDFALTAGEIISVLCGSTGGHRVDLSNSEGCDSGGGGATYVVRSPYNTQQSVLLAAAGGGGSSNRDFYKSPLSSAQGNGDRSNLTVNGTYGGASGIDGQVTVAGVSGSRSGSGVNGYSGGFRDVNLQNSGYTQENGGNSGGGFFSDSNSGRANNTWSTTSHGWAYLDGSNGGISDHPNSFGGFGGGGGGHGNCYISGGGGGGWNGGGAQHQYWNRHGGCGGGSLNNGLNPVNVSGGNYDSSGPGAFGKVEVLRLA